MARERGISTGVGCLGLLIGLAAIGNIASEEDGGEADNSTSSETSTAPAKKVSGASCKKLGNCELEWGARIAVGPCTFRFPDDRNWSHRMLCDGSFHRWQFNGFVEVDADNPLGCKIKTVLHRDATVLASEETNGGPIGSSMIQIRSTTEGEKPAMSVELTGGGQRGIFTADLSFPDTDTDKCPKWDKSEKEQARRKETMDKARKAGMFYKVEPPEGGGSPYVHVTPTFMDLPVDQKGGLAYVVHAYYYDGSEDSAMTMLVDHRTGESVGSFSRELGLSLD